MFINSQTFKRCFTEHPVKYVFTDEVTKNGTHTLFKQKPVPVSDYVKSLEDSVFYTLEVQMKNGVPLTPVNTNFILADPEELGELAENIITSHIINDTNISDNGSTSQNSASEETQL